MHTTEANTRQPPAFARPQPRLPFHAAAPGGAAHDFLVLSQRPDLTPEFFPPPFLTGNFPGERQRFAPLKT
jgi:hypothetical protein